MIICGIDIGGSGIKGALIDGTSGALVSERHRLPTPQPATPDGVIAVVAELVQHFSWKGAIGCTFPAVIKHGVAYTAANVDPSWIGTNVQQHIEQQTGCPTVVLNDADAAGMAEMRFGAGVGQMGTVMMLTLGTGIGSAMFSKGVLLPNTELGHIEIRGKDAEKRASDNARQKQGMDWPQWAKRLNEYLSYLDMLFTPDLFILGGGVSKKHEKFFHLLQTRAQIVPAHLMNNAGMIGAALAAIPLALPPQDYALPVTAPVQQAQAHAPVVPPNGVRRRHHPSAVALHTTRTRSRIRHRESS